MLAKHPDSTDEDGEIEHDEHRKDDTLTAMPEPALVYRSATYLRNIHSTPSAPQASTPMVTSQMEM
jgi:hypothetical protein